MGEHLKPTATIYQNETEVIVVFSKVQKGYDTGRFRGGSISFENHWSDGGSCGLTGFDNRNELNKFLKENRYIRKGTVNLGNYCYSKHENEDGSTSTCILKDEHKGQHKPNISGQPNWK